MDVFIRSGSSPMKVVVDGLGEFVTTKIEHVADRGRRYDYYETGKFDPLGPAPQFDPLDLRSIELHGGSDAVLVTYDHHKDLWGVSVELVEDADTGMPYIQVEHGPWQDRLDPGPVTNVALYRVERIRGSGGDMADETPVEAHESIDSALDEIGF